MTVFGIQTSIAFSRSLIMIVSVSLFPPFSDDPSGETVSVSLKKGTTIRELLELLRAAKGRVRFLLNGLVQQEDQGEELHHRALVLHNGGQGRLDSTLSDGDEIKLFQPLQGG